jgi:hypothetical protein
LVNGIKKQVMVKKDEFNSPLREPLNDDDVNPINTEKSLNKKGEGKLYPPLFLKRK